MNNGKRSKAARGNLEAPLAANHGKPLRRARGTVPRQNDLIVRRSWHDDQNPQNRLQQLVHQLLRLHEAERKKMSRQLHDEIGQNLTGVNVRLAALKRELHMQSAPVVNRIAAIQSLVEAAMKRIHQFVQELRPTLLDDIGLVSALQAYLKNFGKRNGLQIRFTAFTLDKVHQLSEVAQTALYRVAQEALSNIHQHAAARLVKVHIQKTPGGVRMIIKDDGKSFCAAQLLNSKTNPCCGLWYMKEQMEMVGGSLEIDSSPGEGTAICAQVSPILPVQEKLSLKKAKAARRS